MSGERLRGLLLHKLLDFACKVHFKPLLTIHAKFRKGPVQLGIRNISIARISMPCFIRDSEQRFSLISRICAAFSTNDQTSGEAFQRGFCGGAL
jgi:hypothetical protein